MQTLGSRDYLPGIDSAGPYPSVNHADVLTPTRYTTSSTMGNEDPPHVAMASVHFISLHTSFANDCFAEGPWSTST